MTNEMGTAINKVIGKVTSDWEKESWEKKTRAYYRINVIREKKWGFDRQIPATDLDSSMKYEQSHGVTREEAIKLAGRDGQVYIHTVTIERIK